MTKTPQENLHETLLHSKAFYQFLCFVRSERDATLKEMDDAPIERLGHIAGQISAYDRILENGSAGDMLHLDIRFRDA